MMMFYHKRQEELKVRKGWINRCTHQSVWFFSTPAPGIFRNWKRQMMIATWTQSGRTDRPSGNSFKAWPTSNGGQDDDHCLWNPRLASLQICMQLTKMPCFHPEIKRLSLSWYVYMPWSRWVSELIIEEHTESWRCHTGAVVKRWFIFVLLTLTFIETNTKIKVESKLALHFYCLDIKMNSVACIYTQWPCI